MMHGSPVVENLVKPATSGFRYEDVRQGPKNLAKLHFAFHLVEQALEFGLFPQASQIRIPRE